MQQLLTCPGLLLTTLQPLRRAEHMPPTPQPPPTSLTTRHSHSACTRLSTCLHSRPASWQAGKTIDLIQLALSYTLKPYTSWGPAGRISLLPAACRTHMSTFVSHLVLIPTLTHKTWCAAGCTSLFPGICRRNASSLITFASITVLTYATSCTAGRTSLPRGACRRSASRPPESWPARPPTTTWVPRARA